MSFTTSLSRLALCGTLAVALSLGGSPGAQADEPTLPQYTLRLLLPAEGHTVASAYGINDNGDVTGITRPAPAPQPQHAALWTTADVATALPQLEGSRFGRGFDLSSSATVAGEAFDASGASIPVAWTKDSITPLPSVSDKGRGVAVDIAESGRVLGVANNGTMGVAYLVDGTTATTLEAPAVDEGKLTSYRATAISPDGRWVAGVSWVDVPHGDHAHSESILTVWQDGRPTTWEPADHGPSLSALNIHDSGMVVGFVKPRRHAVAATWRDGVLTTLADPAVEGFPHVTATASNSAGVIVGTASKFEGNSTFGAAAVAWFGGKAVNLNTLTQLPEGVTLQDTRDINASGQIVGTAKTPQGPVGYVLTPTKQPAPTPEPTATPSVPGSPAPSATATSAPSAAPSSTPSSTPTGKPRPGLPSTGR